MSKLSYPEWQRRVAALQGKEASVGLTAAEKSYLTKLLGRAGKGHGYSRDAVIATAWESGSYKGIDVGGAHADARVDAANQIGAQTLRPQGGEVGQWSAGFNSTVGSWGKQARTFVGSVLSARRQEQAATDFNKAPLGGSHASFSTAASFRYVAERWASSVGSYVVRSSGGKWDRQVAVLPGGSTLTTPEAWMKVARRYPEAVLEVCDEKAARWAWGTWRAWPVFSGYSKANVSLAWLDKGGDLTIRYTSWAPYSLIAKPISRALGRGRAQMAAVVADIATATRGMEV